MKMEFLKNFLCFCLLCSVTAQSNKPNIILLIADDLGWNDVGFHGSNEIPTPNIDALAYNGIILNRHYTQPTCTPSRAALMTGKYPIRFGLQGEPLKEGTPDSLALNETLLPQHLKELGYSTNLIGKWHLGFYKEGCTPTARGFDRHFGYYNGWARYNDSVTFTKQNGEDVIGLDAWENNQHAGEKLRNKYNTDVFTDEAINIIKSHNTKKPLFLDLSFTAVHAIFNCQLQVRDLQQNEKQFAYIKDPNRRMFAGVLSALDESVGRIMEALHQKNILNNTIVLFMADNGGATEDSEGLFQNYASNWPLRGWKSSVTEGGIRGAAAIWSPLIKKNYVSERTTHLIDWLPTFYAAAGGDTSQLGDIDGINQWNFLKDPDNKVHNHKRKLLLNIDEVKGDEAIIDGNWKFIRILSKPKSFGGSSGRDDEYSYNMTSVMTSPTNRVIGVYSNRTAIKLKEKFWKLRNKAKIDKYCKNRLNDTNNENGSNARCFEKGCLFHINKDHCEFHDLSKVHKNKYKALQKKLNKFRASLVKQKASSFDPNSDPKYYDGYWTPWIEDEIEN